MMSKALFKTPSAVIVLVLFVILTGWWFLNDPFSPDETLQHQRFIWGAVYQIIALWGAISGFAVAIQWGGLKSVVGKSLSFFSLGLLLQAFGQSVYSFYNLYLQVEAPYPSLGDIGFFGSIPCYIIAIFFLSRAAGAGVSLRSYINKIQAIIIPAILLIISYQMFLQHYEFDFSSPLRIFLDFGYPLGQTIYISLAVLSFILSRKILGGSMRGPVFMVLLALTVQYFADFNFLYQFSHETWYVGGVGDYLYLVAYSCMALALIQLGNSFKRLMEN